MRLVLKKNRIILSFLASIILLASFLFSALGSPSPTQALFTNLDEFVLFSEEEVHIEKETQVSSGDIGSNNRLNIEQDALINGNLFADNITIDKDTQINGDASFNTFQIKKDAQILGAQTEEVSLPIAIIPTLGTIQPGQDSFIFEGQDNTLPPGAYNQLTLNENSRLILTGGIYNIKRLELQQNSTLIFLQLTRLNIKHQLIGGEHILILPGPNTKPDDLLLNFTGNTFIHFGKQSFLNFNLLAPKANIRLGKETTFRGQIIAKRIFVGKDAILSREQTITRITKPEDIVTDPDGGVYPTNELLLHLAADSGFADAVEIVSLVDGRVVGVVSSINLYQLELPVGSIVELESILRTLQNLTDPRIQGVFRNFVIPID